MMTLQWIFSGTILKNAVGQAPLGGGTLTMRSKGVNECLKRGSWNRATAID